ncbi:universal stress protein UspA-like protein [Xenococcus sp. PCC 7305]|uniref:universal stress protein n=1 Tax=Xenococcus sp. PCC 7305 TaxID=102125 RepID=UPI0002AC9E6A|nr:universal stress protein [Xenococcus sp. PCC 7305]ELS05244.1 universal stress protein UspA-like protein [Xenococcus sp. PCC 7305]
MIAVEKPPLAFKVADTGFALAKALNAQVLLMHINPPALLYSPDSGTSPDQIKYQMNREAENFLQKLVKLYGDNLEVSSFILEGNTEHEIIKAINDIKPDILILGTHGKKAWQELLLGSVSEDIIRHSTCPVMLIRESPTDPI